MTAAELDETQAPQMEVWAEAPDGAVAGTESTDSFRCGMSWEMNQPPARRVCFSVL